MLHALGSEQGAPAFLQQATAPELQPEQLSRLLSISGQTRELIALRGRDAMHT